ncbi:hypothetical protein COCNU_scaffold000146G000010 [Cocos nucifera]|nr:hypothetical protein [Cocos nucifera]
MKEKVAKNENLRRALRKEEFISIGLKATLALEEEKKEAEIKIAELEIRMSKSISEKAFIKDFELYEGRVARKCPELDLNFLEEDPDEEVRSFDATTDPSPIEVVFESFEPVVEVPEPIQELEVVSEASVKLVPEPMANPRLPSSSAAFPSEVGSL